jgi:hypothetical protein
MYAQGTTLPSQASLAGMSTSGCLVWMTSVSGVGVSVRSIVSNKGRMRAALTDGSNVRSRLYLASTAVNRLPSWAAHVLAQREVPCRRPRAPPGSRQRGVECTVGMAAEEVVEEVERHASIARIHDPVGVEGGQIAVLEDDDVTLLRGVSDGSRGTVGKTPGVPTAPNPIAATRPRKSRRPMDCGGPAALGMRRGHALPPRMTLEQFPAGRSSSPGRPLPNPVLIGLATRSHADGRSGRTLDDDGARPSGRLQVCGLQVCWSSGVAAAALAG